MALAGLPEDIARQVREARPRKLVEKEAEKRRQAEQAEERMLEDGQMPPVQLAERLIASRTRDTELLLRATKACANVLEKSGRELQRIASVVRADKGFKRSLQSGDPPIAQAGLGALDAFAGLGAAMLGMSRALADDTFGGLSELRKNIRAGLADSIVEMAALEQQEDLCNEAVKQATKEKEKFGSDLSSEMQDHEAYEGGGLSSWFRKPSNSRLQHAANGQRAAVEELAVAMDRAATARETTKKGSDALKKSVNDADKKVKAQIKEILQRCGAVWEATVHGLEAGAIVRLNGGAAAARAPGQAEHASEPGMLSAKAAAAMEASAQEELSCVEVCFPESEDSDREAESPKQQPSKLPSRPTDKPPHQQRATSADPSPGTRAERIGKALREGDKQKGTLEELAHEAASAAGSILPMPPLPTGSEDPPLKEVLVTVRFAEGVQRLGFEVLWESDWPSVLKVLPDGEAQRAGLVRGDVLKEINGTCTRGRGRDEMMPLLKLRPLVLILDAARRKPTRS